MLIFRIFLCYIQVCCIYISYKYINYCECLMKKKQVNVSYNYVVMTSSVQWESSIQNTKYLPTCSKLSVYQYIIIILCKLTFYLIYCLAEDIIFWVDTKANTISRIKRDLTEREVIVQDGINSVEGLAVDWIASMYFFS